MVPCKLGSSALGLTGEFSLLCAGTDFFFTPDALPQMPCPRCPAMGVKCALRRTFQGGLKVKPAGCGELQLDLSFFKIECLV